MEIRLLTPTDAKSYWDLRLEALKQNPESFAQSYEDAIMRKNPLEQVRNNFSTKGNFTLGAFDQGKLVGVVTLIQEQAVKIRHRATIYAMYVTPKNRKHGIGKALLTEAISVAESLEEVTKINLSVVSQNEQAKNLYTSLGFKVFGTEKGALKIDDQYLTEDHMVLFIR
ncbi:GNAT family N-acetyltransferase [Risungbinella massiliensis]|uniref:GNAT family N-acetyltransferase n=1 Tax=Risungbinella massiliensis TaxID=1329796 RepID=UPI0005CB8A0A|nr:GNAT family N-acetyltransferase [Risungbinella massiliensis]